MSKENLNKRKTNKGLDKVSGGTYIVYTDSAANTKFKVGQNVDVLSSDKSNVLFTGTIEAVNENNKTYEVRNNKTGEVKPYQEDRLRNASLFVTNGGEIIII